MADFLVIADLFQAVGAKKVKGYFDDNFNGTISDETAAVDDVLSMAEGEMSARMLKAYPGDITDPTSALRVLIDNDPALKSHVVSVALQYAAERRPEFTDAEGVGPYKTRWTRAIAYFDLLSKGTLRSRGETQAGKGANTGGNLSPEPPAQTTRQFIFASSRNSPQGHGGF